MSVGLSVEKIPVILMHSSANISFRAMPHLDQVQFSSVVIERIIGFDDLCDSFIRSVTGWTGSQQVDINARKCLYLQ